MRLINGPEAFTPDGEFILGPTDVRGFWVAAGFCAHGLAGAGGMGKLVAEWIVEGTPSLDVWHMDSRRFGAAYTSREYTLARTTEVYSTYYDVTYPGHEREAGRPLRLPPAYPRLRGSAPPSARRPAGSGRTGSRPNAAAGDESLRPRGWAGRHWSPAIGASTAPAARRPRFDESFAKIEVSGPGAAELLEWLCDNRVARDVGAITYTQMLNGKGGIECDFTVTRGSARIDSGSSPAPRSAATIWPGSASTRRTTAPFASTTSPPPMRASASGGRRAARSSRR